MQKAVPPLPGVKENLLHHAYCGGVVNALIGDRP
jgi:hypothetical protein